MVIYEQRRRVLEGDDLSEEVKGWIEETVAAGVQQFTDADFTEEWDVAGLIAHMEWLYGTDITLEELAEEASTRPTARRSSRSSWATRSTRTRSVRRSSAPSSRVRSSAT